MQQGHIHVKDILQIVSFNILLIFLMVETINKLFSVLTKSNTDVFYSQRNNTSVISIFGYSYVHWNNLF